MCDSPRPAAAKPAPAAQPTPAPPKPTTPSATTKPTSAPVIPPESDEQFLTQFGFPLTRVQQALKEKKSREAALEWLLLGGDAPTPPKPEPKVEPKVEAKAAPKSVEAPKVSPATKPSAGKPAIAAKSVQTKPATDPKLEKERLQQAAERAKERERLAEIERQRLAELRLTAIANSTPEAKRVIAVSREEQERLDAIKQDIQKGREAERLAELDAAEAKRKRKEQESAFRDVPSALSSIATNYDSVRYQLVCSTFAKIINKILQEPQNLKFQSLNLSSEALQQPILRTVGSFAILLALGFKQAADERWTLEAAAVGKLGDYLKYFVATPTQHAASSSIPDLLNTIDEKKAPLEMVYFVALELRNTFRNCINLPNNLEATSVDTETLNFRRRIKRIPKALQILEEYGFKKPERAGDVFWKCTVDVQHLTDGVMELNRVIHALAPLTPIAVGLKDLLQHNSPKIVAAVLEAVRDCIKRITTEPQETKYRRFKPDKLWKKIAGEKGVRGGNEFLTLFGFAVKEHGDIVTNDEGVEEIVDSATGSSLAFLAPKGYDPELFKLRLDDLTRCWKESKHE